MSVFYDKEFEEIKAWLDIADSSEKTVKFLVNKSFGSNLMKELKESDQCSMDQYETLEYYLYCLGVIYRHHIQIKETLCAHKKKAQELLSKFKGPNSSARMSHYLNKIMEKARQECTAEEYAELKGTASILERANTI